ncbi:LuxR family transcriptional regulator [Methyloprofundus sedimenti]|uniref:LuxR family transcriptional regulator n=1 Tax=Methyloprofundus sedimenti TaxID=1420851 RepID=A0A1V8M1U8_9GAMM|nr:response regulator [Methyloprofundus sedimenti]OQK15537.1 LuxR family transcriptional regulator [Methyloprofundus sedimenti]
MKNTNYDTQTHNGTILIVDDTPANLAVLSDILSESNYRILVATDGLSALEQIQYLSPDIILLDVMMPGINGFETCHQLKKNPLTAFIPIIFMTGLSDLENLLRGFDEGAVDYIVKPIRPHEVLARIQAQLAQTKNLRRAEDTLDQIAFAALAFDNSGLITWLTATAVKALHACMPNTETTAYDVGCGDILPKQILDQVNSRIKKTSSNIETIINDIQVGKRFSGKVIPCQQIGEYLLLIQKNAQDWDLASLKSSFGLTAREAEILMWISRGKTNKDVGLILDTSPRTVNKHLEHIFEKLGVPTRAAAVTKVMNNNTLGLV